MIFAGNRLPLVLNPMPKLHLYSQIDLIYHTKAAVSETSTVIYLLIKIKYIVINALQSPANFDNNID